MVAQNDTSLRGETTKQSASLIPELRFKEFDWEWEKKTLKDISKINQGLQIAISERFTEFKEGLHFYITNEFLRANSSKKYYIQNPAENVLCDVDDILMTRTGNTGQVVTGVKGAFHNNFFKIAYNSNCNKWFLYYFLTDYKTQHTILKYAGTSTIPDLNHGDFYRLKINIPKLPEQQKIASFLTAVDKKLQQLTTKKEQLKHYKKGVMQQLFSQQLRFKDDDGNDFPDWEEKKLGEVCKSIKSGKSKADDDGYYPLYGSTGKIGKCVDFSHDGIFILIARVGANAGKINLVNDKFGVSDNTLVLSCNKHTKREYLYFYLDYFNLNRLVFGSGQPLITGGQLKSLKLKVPSLKEQQKIATYLSSLDDKIETVAGQIDKTQEFKKGLLQQLFV
jgi:type I restriction enzyme S subunit